MLEKSHNGFDLDQIRGDNFRPAVISAARLGHA
jgi:hypothetical protein